VRIPHSAYFCCRSVGSTDRTLISRPQETRGKNCAVLGCYVASIGTTRFILDSRLLNMEPIDCSETSVRNCHYSLRNNPEERSSRLFRGGSLKPTQTRDISVTSLQGVLRELSVVFELWYSTDRAYAFPYIIISYLIFV